MTLPVHYLQARQAAAVRLDHVALHLLHALPQRLVQLPQPLEHTSHVNWHTRQQRTRKQQVCSLKIVLSPISNCARCSSACAAATRACRCSRCCVRKQLVLRQQGQGAHLEVDN